MAGIDTQSAKSNPICTKSMLRHPKPRCIDFTGKVRYKHDWTQEKESETDKTLTESQCTVCGNDKDCQQMGRRSGERLAFMNTSPTLTFYHT